MSKKQTKATKEVRVTKKAVTEKTPPLPTTAALIIGIDGWEQYTRPLIESIQKHEPDCQLVVIDNGSKEPYPAAPHIYRTERLCYSAAINTAASHAPKADWLIVLSNDVLCTGPFSPLALPPAAVYGEIAEVAGYKFAMGWCVTIPRPVWDKVGGWDENYVMSSWEDVDYSYMARAAGFGVVNVTMPFVHLDQRQRFDLPGFAGTHDQNRAYFEQKHGFVP